MSDPLHQLLQHADRALAETPRAVSAETLLAASQRQRVQTKRRRIATLGVAASMAGLAVALVAVSSSSPAPRETGAVVQSRTPAHIDIPAPRTPEELRAEIAALESEAASRSSAIKLLIASGMSNLSNLNNFGQPHATKDDNSQRLSALSSLSSFATGSPNVESANPRTLADMAELAESASDVDPNRSSALNPAEWLRVESARTAALSWHYANMAEHEFHDIPAAVREYQRLVERFPGTTWAQRSQVSLDRLLTSHNPPL
jgi:hypothetical protein